MKKLVLGLALGAVLAACGGGGGGEGNSGGSEAVNTQGGGAPDGAGAQAGGGAAPGGGGAAPGGGMAVAPITSGPTPPSFPITFPAPPTPVAPAPTLASTCVHTGSGQEFNVGGPMGAPNRVDTIGAVPWETLAAGDTVRIHWRDTPYAERIALFRSGTAAQPVRVCGVLGGPGGNQRPAITGRGATTRAVPAFSTGVTGALAAYGVVTINGQNFESRVEHVVIEGLRIGDTKLDDGVTNATFTNASGATVTYNAAAACIRLRQAHHITIRNNEIVNCGDGLFAGSLPDSNNHVIRHLLVEGNYLHGNAVIGNESRHQAYLQGIDITVQFNYFGQMRTTASAVAPGNQLKTRAAGLVVRYNYFLNGARAIDMVEAEEHITFIAPWQYARRRQQYLACNTTGCLGLSPAQLAEYDARHQEDWAKYQAAYVYGNLIHIRGRDNDTTLIPTNLIHYGHDNTQHDRQPGTLWFFHNTVLWETDRDNHSLVRLFDYSGSDFGDGGYYGYAPTLRNVGDRLHYITNANNDDTCQTLLAGCVDWGPMLQTRIEDFGRMRGFNNALVIKPFSTANASNFELARRLSDRMEIAGATWLSDRWNVSSNNWEGAGFPRTPLTAQHVYPGGNDNHHITGVENIITGAPGVIPVDNQTFAPVTASPLYNAASPWPTELADALRPQFSVTIDPAQPGRLLPVPRSALSTIGAVQ